MIVPTTLKMQLSHIRKFIGLGKVTYYDGFFHLSWAWAHYSAWIRKKTHMLESMTSMSLLNRFIIRPMGVWSKKLMGARIIRCSMAEWSRRLATFCPNARTNAEDKMKIPKEEKHGYFIYSSQIYHKLGTSDIPCAAPIAPYTPIRMFLSEVSLARSGKLLSFDHSASPAKRTQIQSIQFIYPIQLYNQSINQSINRPSINKFTNQSINRYINRSINDTVLTEIRPSARRIWADIQKKNPSSDRCREIT